MRAADLDRLKALAKPPERVSMTREHQFPSMAAKHIADEQEMVVLRNGLTEATVEIERLEKALRWLARNDANGWIREKVKEVLG